MLSSGLGWLGFLNTSISRIKNRWSLAVGRRGSSAWERFAVRGFHLNVSNDVKSQVADWWVCIYLSVLVRIVNVCFRKLDVIVPNLIFPWGQEVIMRLDNT